MGYDCIIPDHCLSISFSFGLLCVSFVNVYQFLSVSFWFGGGVACGI